MQGRRLLGQEVLGRGIGAVRRVLGRDGDEDQPSRQGASGPDGGRGFEGGWGLDGGWDPDVDSSETGAAPVGEAAHSWPGEDLDDPYGEGDAWWERA